VLTVEAVAPLPAPGWLRWLEARWGSCNLGERIRDAVVAEAQQQGWEHVSLITVRLRWAVRGYDWRLGGDNDAAQEDKDRQRKEFESWLQGQLELAQTRTGVDGPQRRVIIVRVHHIEGETTKETQKGGLWIPSLLTRGECFEIAADLEEPLKPAYLEGENPATERKPILGGPFFIGQAVPRGSPGWAVRNPDDFPLLSTVHARIDWADQRHWIRSLSAHQVAATSSYSDGSQWVYALADKPLELRPGARIVLGLIGRTGEPIRGSLILRSRHGH